MGSISVPFGAAGPRLPTKRPRPLPPAVTNALLAMVWEGVDRVLAAKNSGLKPDTLRKWLLRPEAHAFLRIEHDAYLRGLCAANPHRLAQIRDREAGNDMAKVHSVRLLADMNEQGSMRRTGEVPGPGITIRIVNIAQPPATPVDATPPKIIDAEGDSASSPAVDRDPIFRIR